MYVQGFCVLSKFLKQRLVNSADGLQKGFPGGESMLLGVMVLENPLHDSFIPGVVAITRVIFFDLFNRFVRQAHTSTQLFPLSSQWNTSDYDVVPTLLV